MTDYKTPHLLQLIGETLAQFDETFSTVVGIYLDRNTSLFETLADITAVEASIPVSANCAALSAQVDHTRFYMDVMEKVLLGQDAGENDWNHIWATVGVVTEAEWTAIQTRLHDSHDRVRALIAAPETWARDDGFGAALAIVTHTAFHLGQIRQSLCTLRP